MVSRTYGAGEHRVLVDSECHSTTVPMSNHAPFQAPMGAFSTRFVPRFL